MRKYLQSYEIYNKILGITKRRVTVVTLKIVWVFDVKKVAYELSATFAKAGAPQANNDSNNRPEIFHKKIFLQKVFIEM